MILAGDIGGTKSLLGLFEGRRCVAQAYLTNAEFSSFDAVLDAFLKDHKEVKPTRGCLALAGPVADDGRSARLTNLPWVVDAAALERRYAITHIALVNDFAAAAMGAVTALPEQLLTLQAGTPLANSPRLVIGAGTGLGMAMVVPSGNAWRILPGEGGHAAFAPSNDEQVALWQFLQKRHGRVIWEHVVSGRGLVAIHEFLGGGQVDAATIGTQAIAEPDSLAARALNIFLSAYGAVAGDVALLTLARGGVYLAGGIAAKVLPALKQGCFLEAFNAKAGHSVIVRQMPIHLALDSTLGLKGAAALASPA